MQEGMDPRVASPQTRAEAQDEFTQHVIPRRLKAGVDGDPGGAWGLALSGGGIRSATFCLGLVRGLARRGLLKQFDYLSTVSGGGYLGASLGRLYGNDADADQVQDGVARNDSMWLWWLRNNGRYLTPSGAKDLGYAAASIVRGVISTHLEIGILILAMASLVLLPHALVALFPPFRDGTPWNYSLVSAMPSVWGWLLVLPAFACIHQVCAYWYTRESQSLASIALIVVAAAACAWLSWVAIGEGLREDSAARCILGMLAIAPVTAVFASLYERLRKTPAAVQRLMRTKRFSYGLWGLGIGLALMALDWCTWQLTALYWSDDLSRAAYKIGVMAIVLAAVGRLVLPELQRWMATVKGPSLNLERILNALGIALSLLAAIAWTTLLSAWLFQGGDRLTYWSVDWSNLRSIPLVLHFLLVFTACTAYLLATRRSFDLLNLASLHNFYRARIERAYVSSGNSGGPGARFPASALEAVTPSLTIRMAPLTEAIDGDDIEIERYRPQESGGPIHLVNCCINQSVDDRTGLYNADRKGVAMAVSSLGVEAGTNLPDGEPLADSIGKLSKWVAISGAAASTGMGSRTSPGFAALLFMSGIRLGFWTPSLVRRSGEQEQKSKSWSAGLLRWAPKPLAIVAESIARFPGLFSPMWYVSDGGHFDNTGIYALLKRRPRLILAADCGADPKYLFGDLESLVRKAKIDYGASIEFVDDTAIPLPAPLCEVLGTPESIGPEPGKHWLVVGRIVYSDRSEGVLAVVKPRRLDAMPFDMVAYADRNPDYPQQTTGDQFFDESQWESYHQLGLLMGGAITPELLRQAEQVASGLRQANSSLEKAQQQATQSDKKSDRVARARLAVRGTIGAGLSLSVLIAAWQGIEQYRQSRNAEQRQYDARVLDLSEKIRTQPPDALLQEQFSELAAESMTRGDGRFETVLQRLNARCETIAEGSDKTSCVALHKRLLPLLKKKPEPFFDYWFADKKPQYDKATAMRQPESEGEFDPATASAPAYLPAPAPAVGTPMPGAIAALPPPPAPAPMPSVDARPPAAVPATATDSCAQGVRLYVQVYDEESRAQAKALGKAVMRATGARSAPIENVVATARHAGRASPYVWTKPTVVYPEGSSQACIERLRALVIGELGTQKIPTGTPNYLELWIPPRSIDPIAVRSVP